MSVEYQPFCLGDLAQMDIQERHSFLRPWIFRDYLVCKEIMEGPWSWTAWNQYGVPVAACGIVEPDGFAWAFLATNMRKHMVSVTRKVHEVLNAYTMYIGPVWADIDETHAEAVKWAKYLGFQKEAGNNSRWIFSGDLL